jgi:predicted membrane-bound spermidine synthase
MALEVSAFRIIGKTFGSALRETTTVIAVFLAAMAAGYWAGGRAGDRWPRTSTLVAALGAATASLLVVPWLDAWLSPRIAASDLALAAHAFLAASLLFALPTFLLASTSPIAVRLFATDTGHSGSTAGSISAISTAGSIVGSLLTAFFLIDWLESISRTVLFVAVATCATAVLVILSSTRRHRRFGPAGAALAVFAVLSTAFTTSGSIDRTLLVDLPGTRVVFLGDSAYHRVMVRDRGPARELYFNIAPQTRMLLRDPYGPGLPYTDAPLVAPLLRPGIRRVLIVGLGGGTVVKHFNRHYPEVLVDVVEIDPLVVEVASKFFGITPNDRLRIHIADGRTFLKRTSMKWDYVFIDATTTNRYGETVPPHLVTREYFQELSGHLTEDAIVHYHCVFNATAMLPALHKTMSSVFPFVLEMNGEVLASHVAINAQKEVLSARARASPVAHLPHLQRYIASIRSGPLAADEGLLLTDDYAPVDTLLRGR